MAEALVLIVVLAGAGILAYHKIPAVRDFVDGIFG